jgi:hypothetical protein
MAGLCLAIDMDINLVQKTLVDSPSGSDRNEERVTTAGWRRAKNQIRLVSIVQGETHCTSTERTEEQHNKH